MKSAEEYEILEVLHVSTKSNEDKFEIFWINLDRIVRNVALGKFDFSIKKNHQNAHSKNSGINFLNMSIKKFTEII